MMGKLPGMGLHAAFIENCTISVQITMFHISHTVCMPDHMFYLNTFFECMYKYIDVYIQHVTCLVEKRTIYNDKKMF